MASAALLLLLYVLQRCSSFFRHADTARRWGKYACSGKHRITLQQRLSNSGSSLETGSSSPRSFFDYSFDAGGTSTAGSDIVDDPAIDEMTIDSAQADKVVARIITWIIRRIIIIRTKYVSGLAVRVMDTNRNLLSGKVNKLEMSFDAMHYREIRVSGGKLIIQGLELRRRRFLFGLGNRLSLRRPYRIYGDFLLTQSDIVNSPMIKNLFQLLLNTIFERVLSLSSSVVSADINKVSILNRRIYATGDVNTFGDVGKVGFEVSFGIGIRREGRVIYLKDIEVALNPDSVLRASVPIIPTTPIDVDVGESCRIENLVVTNENVWVRAVSVISPELCEPNASSNKSDIAFYRYDLANLLSRMLRLQGGIFLPPAVKSM